MIDTLMMAYTVEMVNMDKVMTCIHQFSCGNAEEKTPYDTEDAITTWINKVCVCFFLVEFTVLSNMTNCNDIKCLNLSSWYQITLNTMEIQDNMLQKKL